MDKNTLRTVAGLTLAICSFALAVTAAKPRYIASWHELVPNGAPVGARIGDRISISPRAPGRITILSYPVTVAKLDARRGRPAYFESYGHDTYEIWGERDNALDITLYEMHPGVPPLVVALLLLVAALSVFWTLAHQIIPRAKVGLAWDPSLAAAVGVVSLLLFLLVPRYVHNDEWGGGLRWGYLGWGYIDTMAAIPRSLMENGLLGLLNVESNVKPIVYPLLVSFFAVFTSSLGAAVVASALVTAAAAAGIFVLGRMLFDRWTGLFAAGLFVFSPIALGYATAFYGENAFLAFTIWSTVLIIGALRRRSRSWLLAGAMLGALAVGSKALIAVTMYAAALFISLCAAEVRIREAAKITALSALGAFLASVFLWPFLWANTADRLRLALIGRVLFDQYQNITAPWLERGTTALVQTTVHTDPLTLVFFVVGLGIALKQRNRTTLWLASGVVAGIAFVLPTAFYLQHYWFYTVPFLQLVAGRGAAVMFDRFRPYALAVTCGLMFLWSAVYFPYSATAAIGCSTIDCSLRRWGASETVYGLSEAAQWINRHLPRGAEIGTLAAPHVLQPQLHDHPVKLIYLPKGRLAQEKALDDSGVPYLVTNAWSRYAANETISTAKLQEVWRGTPRAGSPAVFRVVGSADRFRGLDAPPTNLSSDLIPHGAKRIVLFPRTVSYQNALPAKQVVMLSEARYPLQDTRGLLGLGGGVALFADRSPLPAVFDFESPLTKIPGGVSYALPTLNGLVDLQTGPLGVRLTKANATIATVFIGEIIPVPAMVPFVDGFEVSVRFRTPLTDPQSLSIAGICGRSFVRLAPLWMSPFEVRAYDVADARLGQCLRRGLPVQGYVFIMGDLRRSAHAQTGLLWNRNNALARGAAAPIVLFGLSQRIASLSTASSEDALHVFTESQPKSYAIVPSRYRQFDLEADQRQSLSDKATLLFFSRPSPSFSRILLGNPHFVCTHCSLSGGALHLDAKGAVTWTWPTRNVTRSGRALELDMRNLRISDGAPMAAGVRVIGPKNQICHQWYLGRFHSGHVLRLQMNHFAEVGCPLGASTALSLALSAVRHGATVQLTPKLSEL